ncbi:MAG: hypothetical protein DMF68_01875 [Acidobacteria bacterium]|nr:MAG: hypothetical protein DMF68_01875 [Acidobacteriota bacterium]
MGASNALLITTSSFTKDAAEFSASRYDLQIADYERVIEWIKQYDPVNEDELYLPKHRFYSCFISYSHKDEEFAKKLYARMRGAGLRVWYAPEEIKGGQKLHKQIFNAIQVHDKLLLVLSEHSLQSEWVMTEIRRTRKAERRTAASSFLSD